MTPEERSALYGHWSTCELALKATAAERDRYKAALEEIASALGPPCNDNKCAGCGAEMDIAREAAFKALGGSFEIGT